MCVSNPYINVLLMRVFQVYILLCLVCALWDLTFVFGLWFLFLCGVCLFWVLHCVGRMFVVCCSYVQMLDLVTSWCHLLFHSYLREVTDDGIMIGGVELEVDAPGSDALTIRRFFWS